MVNSTQYTIDHGNTLVGGTGYVIEFGSEPNYTYASYRFNPQASAGTNSGYRNSYNISSYLTNVTDFYNELDFFSATAGGVSSYTTAYIYDREYATQNIIDNEYLPLICFYSGSSGNPYEYTSGWDISDATTNYVYCISKTALEQGILASYVYRNGAASTTTTFEGLIEIQYHYEG